MGWPCNSAGWGGRFIYGRLERKSYLGVARGGFLPLRPRLQVKLFSNFREENAPKYAPLLALYLLPTLFAGIGINILSNVIVRNIEGPRGVRAPPGRWMKRGCSDALRHISQRGPIAIIRHRFHPRRSQ